MTFTLSIEPTDQPSFQHGFHLGTIETVAKRCAEDIFHARNANGQPTCTVALIRDRKIFDVFDGKWSSESGFDEIFDRDEYATQAAIAS